MAKNTTVIDKIKNDMKQIQTIVTGILCMLVTAGCKSDKTESLVDAQTYTAIDHSHDEVLKQLNSDIYYCEENNCDSLVEVIDSLQHEGWLPQPLADYGRGMCYMQASRERLAENYLRKAMDHIELRQWPATYFCTVDNLCNLLLYKNDYEGAMKVSRDPYEWLMRDRGQRIDEDTYDKYYGNLLNIIGTCQLMMGRRAEGTATMEQALEYTRMRALEDTTDLNRMYAWSLLAVNTALTFSDTDDNDDERWVNEADEAVSHLSYVEGIDQRLVDESVGRAASLRAIWLAQHGRLDEAKEAFRRHRATRYSETEEAREEQLDYYKAAGRYDKAVRLLEAVRHHAREAGTHPSLDYLIFLGKSIDLYHRTGRDDDVVKVALEMAALADSVRKHERENDAQELAVIYETQQKEQELYQQRWQMRRLQGAAVAAILTLLLIAVGIFAWLRNRSTRQLQRKNAELVRLAAAKQNFLNNISHEMRTPLNCIVGFSQVLLTPGLELTDEEYDDMEQRIKESSQMLTDIVDKMIELSYYDAKTEVECIDTVELKGLCREVMGQYTTRAKPDVRLRIACDGEAVYTVVTNNDLLRRVLCHLMDNAVRFTEKGEILMYIHRLKTGQISLSVTDTGCGIPEERRKDLFELFIDTGEQVKTTGMGLSICKTMMRLLGGTIYLDEKYTIGTRMVICLP